MLRRRHPNLYVYLTALAKEGRYAANRRGAFDLGEEPARKKRKYVQNDMRIERIVRRYTEYASDQDDAF